jgi:hypothetical protein
VNGQVVCDHELGQDENGYLWYEHSISDCVSISLPEGVDLAVEFVQYETSKRNKFCPDCGERIDWDAIKAQLGIE